MKTRIVLPRPGRCGWAVPFPGNPLPAGLDERTPVFIVSVDGTGVNARDASGKVWQLARGQVDCGLYFVTPAGGWVHESTVRARNALRHQLRHHLGTQRPQGEAGRPWDEKASYLLWLLQRTAALRAEAPGTRHQAPKKLQIPSANMR
jgi:hypothetical protein